MSPIQFPWLNRAFGMQNPNTSFAGNTFFSQPPTPGLAGSFAPQGGMPFSPEMSYQTATPDINVAMSPSQYAISQQQPMTVQPTPAFDPAMGPSPQGIAGSQGVVPPPVPPQTHGLLQPQVLGEMPPQMPQQMIPQQAPLPEGIPMGSPGFQLQPQSPSGHPDWGTRPMLDPSPGVNLAGMNGQVWSPPQPQVAQAGGPIQATPRFGVDPGTPSTLDFPDSASTPRLIAETAGDADTVTGTGLLNGSPLLTDAELADRARLLTPPESLREVPDPVAAPPAPEDPYARLLSGYDEETDRMAKAMKQQQLWRALTQGGAAMVANPLDPSRGFAGLGAAFGENIDRTLLDQFRRERAAEYQGILQNQNQAAYSQALADKARQPERMTNAQRSMEGFNNLLSVAVTKNAITPEQAAVFRETAKTDLGGAFSSLWQLEDAEGIFGMPNPFTDMTPSQPSRSMIPYTLNDRVYFHDKNSGQPLPPGAKLASGSSVRDPILDYKNTLVTRLGSMNEEIAELEKAGQASGGTWAELEGTSGPGGLPAGEQLRLEMLKSNRAETIRAAYMRGAITLEEANRYDPEFMTRGVTAGPAGPAGPVAGPAATPPGPAGKSASEMDNDELLDMANQFNFPGGPG